MAAQDAVRPSTGYPFLGDVGQAFVDVSFGWCDRYAEPPLRRGLASRTYPALVIWGAHDAVLRAEHRTFVESNLQPECSLTLSATHILQDDVPTEFSAAIASSGLEATA